MVLFGLLLDTLGIKWVRKESNAVKRIVKLITFLIAGVICIVLFFMIFGFGG